MLFDDNNVHVDERGFTKEVYLLDKAYADQIPEEIRRIHFSQNTKSGTRRGFCKHKHLREAMIVLKGSARIIIADPETDIPVKHILSGMDGKVVVVPKQWWHGWESLEDDTMLMYISSQTHDESCTDFEHHENAEEWWG